MRILVIILSLILTRYLFVAGFFPIHDSTHVARVFLMQESILAGNFPPLWANSANQGYGYPLFHFYAPLAYYYALLVKLILPSFLSAIKLSFFTAFSLAGLGIYQLTRKWGNKVALLSTTTYLLAPYLALSLYVRGSLAELWAIALLPWVFWTWHILVKTKTSVIRTAIITTLFLLSHNLIPLITAPFLLVWIIIFKKDYLREIIFASLLTLALSSFYLAPLLFERGFVQVEEIARTTNYSLHYVEPWQLWNSTWGFGGSAVGVEDGISFKLGKLNILLALAGVVALVKRKQYKLNSFLVISILIAVGLMTSYSSFIWDHLVYLQMVQFPWRFLSLIAFFLSILAGFSVLLLKSKFYRAVYTLLAISCMLSLNLKYFTPQSKLDISDATYLEGDFVPATLAHIVPEYLPTWMPDFPISPAPALPATLTGPRQYTLPRAYYPTWQATLSNINTSITPTQDGLIEIDVPEGTHDLVLEQVSTTLEKISLTISLFSVIAIAIYYILIIINRNRKKIR